MKKFCMVLLVTCFFATFTTSSVFAAAKNLWDIPENVYVVQKDSADAGSVFLSLEDAVANIPQGLPTAENHFVIKVMPGSYYQMTSLVIPSYVDIVGEGSESSIITSNTLSELITFSGENEVRGLKFTSKSTTALSTWTSLIVVLENGNVTFKDISVEVPDLDYQFGIDGLQGSTVKLINSKMSLEIGQDNGWVELIDTNGTLEIIGSELIMESKADIYTYPIYAYPNANVLFSDSKAEVTNLVQGAEFSEANNANFVINNSRITLNGRDFLGIYRPANLEFINSTIVGTAVSNGPHALIHDPGNVSISGSKLISTGKAISFSGSGIGNIDSSEIIGDISSSGTTLNIGGSKVAGTISGVVNLVNCYDGNYQLIP
ncbi:MAG: hypothetical protein ACQ9ET_04660 [Nitrosomonadaceae bacterium]